MYRVPNLLLMIASLLLVTGCSAEEAVSDTSTEKRPGIVDRRKSHVTQLVKTIRDEEPLPAPASDLFELVKFPSVIGNLSAWVSRPTQGGKKQPAIIWITGGFPPGGIDESAWEPVAAENDQSAKVYREKGIIIMYPTLRGTFGNPGIQEGFFGEVDDVLAALKYLQSLEHVDRDRIFLGGHSTGGTLVLLVAAMTSEFAGVISFGPVESPDLYGSEYVLHEENDEEYKLRSPIRYLSEIQSPTLVIEGVDGNMMSLMSLKRRFEGDLSNFEEVGAMVSFHRIPAHDHFSVLAPVNLLLAEKIVDLQPGQRLTLSTAP